MWEQHISLERKKILFAMKCLTLVNHTGPQVLDLGPRCELDPQNKSSASKLCVLICFIRHSSIL